MRVRPGKMAPAHKSRGGEPTQKPMAHAFTFPAPIRGLVLNEGLSTPQPGGASILDNWICTTTGIRARGGSPRYATLGAPVRSMFTYNSTTETFFAATDGAIFNITTVADKDVPPTADVTGQTEGYYSTEQFGTAGGDYLYAVNGTDLAQLYDGSSWTQINDTSTPAVTGAPTSDLSHVWSFASRLFFVKKDSKVAYYLPVDSIGGAATAFSLAGIFKKGGSLLFGATWSLDAGDGLDDKCVFVSTEGEVAIYEGTNPGDAAAWRLAGVYNITRPLGPNATMQAGGDLLIATEAGMVPLSAAIRKDTAALSMAAVSKPIAPLWQAQVARLGSQPWEVIKWPQRNIMIVSQPGPDTDEGTCLVANLQTGAWSRVTGWVTRCMGYFDGFGYFSGPTGVVRRMDVSGNDDGMPYTCSYLGLFENMGAQGVQKTVAQMRAMFQSASPIDPQVRAQVDYDRVLSAPPNSVTDSPGAVWDTAIWDTAIWDGEPPSEVVSRWVSIGRTGHAVAPEVQLTFGVTRTPEVELVSIDTTFHVGAMVT